MDAPGFFEYFVDQDAFEWFAVFGLAAALYVVVVTALALVLRRWVPAVAVKAVAVGTAVALLAFAFVLTLFEGAALYYRHAPPGWGMQRQGEALDHFYRWSELAFFSVYAFVVALASAIGWLAARRLPRGRIAVAASTAGTVIAFLAATLPIVEFANACNVGRPLVTDRYIVY